MEAKAMAVKLNFSEGDMDKMLCMHAQVYHTQVVILQVTVKKISVCLNVVQKTIKEVLVIENN